VSDDLVISGSNSSAVATDELFSAAERYAAMTTEASLLTRYLSNLEHEAGLQNNAPYEAWQARRSIAEAEALIADVETRARSLQGGLISAADGYGFVDRFIGAFVRSIASDVAGVLGMFAPLNTLLSMPLILAGGAVAGGISTIPGAKEAASRFMRENNELLTNPLTVTIEREATMVADDAMMGAVGIPRPVADLLGDEGLGISNHATAASGVMTAGSIFGLFRESPVHIVGSKPVVAAPPTGYQERLGRVPDTDETGGAQVVIDKYEMDGEPDRFEVYIAGTVTFNPIAADEPFDMTTNMSNAVGPGSGAYESVAEAMRLAGIDENSPVQFTGYSQGGGTAAQLAASGDYNTAGLATFGGPTGQVAVPEGFTTVIVEHTDDLVPGLGGHQQNVHAVIVERDVFGGREIPTDYAVPAHHYEYYEETARLMDAASSDAITGSIDALNKFGDGAVSVTSTQYRFERD